MKMKVRGREGQNGMRVRKRDWERRGLIE